MSDLPSLSHLVSSDAPRPDGLVEQAVGALKIAMNAYRWTCLTGRAPQPTDWESEPDWPSERDVAATFGSWERMIQALDLDQAAGEQQSAERDRQAAQDANVLAARRRDLEASEQRLQQQRKQNDKAVQRAEQQATDAGQQAADARQDAEQAHAQRREAEQQARDAAEALKAANEELAQLRVRAHAVPVRQSVTDGEVATVTWLALRDVASAEEAWSLAAQWVADGDEQRARQIIDAAVGDAAIPAADRERLAVSRQQAADRERRQLFWTPPARRGEQLGYEITVERSSTAAYAGVRVTRRDGSSGPVNAVVVKMWDIAGLLAEASADHQTLDVADIDQWVSGHLADAGRQLPLVVAGHQCAVDVARFAADACGQARVFSLTGYPAGRRLTEVVEDWSVWGDAVRIYWPGADPSDPDSDPFGHPRLRPTSGPGGVQWLRERLSEYWLNRPYPADLDLAVQAGTLSVTEHSLWESSQSERQRREAAEQQLDQASERIGELEAALSAARRDAAQARASVTADGAAAEQTVPQVRTVVDAVRVAAERCEHLTFAARAFQTAEKSPFKRPQVILDALLSLDEVAGDYEQGALGEKLKTRAERAGLRWAGGVSPLTVSNYERHYTFRHEGKDLTMGPHVSLGSGAGSGNIARIYLHASDGSDGLQRGLIVGHVGVHLPDSTT